MTPEERQLYQDWLERRRPLPGAADLQRAIILAALQLLEAAREPFTSVDWQPAAAAV